MPQISPSTCAAVWLTLCPLKLLQLTLPVLPDSCTVLQALPTRKPTSQPACSRCWAAVRSTSIRQSC